MEATETPKHAFCRILFLTEINRRTRLNTTHTFIKTVSNELCGPLTAEIYSVGKFTHCQEPE